MFKWKMGKEAESKTVKIKGIITARSENLYGCNRYYIQPPAGDDMKVPNGWWIDEEDVVITGEGVIIKKDTKIPGGPISKIK